MYHVYLTNEAETEFLYIGTMDKDAAQWYEAHLNAYIIED